MCARKVVGERKKQLRNQCSELMYKNVMVVGYEEKVRSRVFDGPVEVPQTHERQHSGALYPDSETAGSNSLVAISPLIRKIGPIDRDSNHSAFPSSNVQ